MASGGPRTGSVGGNYPNRSDMSQPAAAPKGQTYGTAQQQIDGQGIVPVAGASSGGGGMGSGEPQMGLEPGSIPSLSDPTARPWEPLTAGLPIGAGAGPEALSTSSMGPQELSIARGIFLQYGGDDLDRAIQFLERNLA